MARIFISYARKDADAANRLAGILAKAGYEAWIDQEIPGGELWKRRVVEEIDKSHVFLILLSPNSAASDNVRKELDMADSRKKLIFPIVIAPMKVPAQMEYSLAGLQRVDFVTDPNAGERQLLNAIRSLRALEEQDTGWESVADTREGRERLNAILADPSRSTEKKIRDVMAVYSEPSEGFKKWQKKMDDVELRKAAIWAEQRDLMEKREKLAQEWEHTSSPEIKNLIEEKMNDLLRRYGSLTDESRALWEEGTMPLLDEASRERDKIMKKSREMLKETNKLTERIWRKDS